MKITTIRLLILTLLLVIFVFTAEAQKRNKKKANETSELSESDLLKAETTLIEAQKQLLLENYEKAYELFELTNQLNPDNAAVYFKLSEVATAQGKTQLALEHIEKAITLDSKNKYYYIFNLEILKSLNRVEDAIKVCEAMLSNVKDTEEYYLELGSLYQFISKWDEAIAAFKKAEKKLGLSESVMLEKQKIYLRSNNMEALIADWSEFIEKNPNDPNYLLQLISVLLANEMREEAAEQLKIFDNKFPDNPTGNLLLSEIFRQEGKRIKALDYLEVPIASKEVEVNQKIGALSTFFGLPIDEDEKTKLKNLAASLATTHPSSSDALAYAGDVYLQLGDNSIAIDYYKKSVLINPGNYGIWQNIVNIEWEQQQYDSLILHTDQALEYFPNQALFYFYNGTAHYIKEDFEKSTQMLELGRKFTNDPGLLAVFYGQLGDAYNGLKSHDKSDEAYEKALKQDPSNEHVLNNYSYFLSLRKEDMDKALEMSEKLVKRFPNNPTYLDTHGWVLYNVEKYEEAAKFLKKAAELDDDGTIYEHLGDVLFKLGDTIGALENWNKAKEMGGTTDKIDQKIEDQVLYE